MNEVIDIGAIKELLKANKLPHEDITTSKVEFITRFSGGNLIRCIGLERYNQHGLLRSLAVHHLHRNKGVGNYLINKLFHLNEKHGIKQLHLLTTNATDYFKKIWLYSYKTFYCSN